MKKVPGPACNPRMDGDQCFSELSINQSSWTGLRHERVSFLSSGNDEHNVCSRLVTPLAPSPCDAFDVPSPPPLWTTGTLHVYRGRPGRMAGTVLCACATALLKSPDFPRRVPDYHPAM